MVATLVHAARMVLCSNTSSTRSSRSCARAHMRSATSPRCASVMAPTSSIVSHVMEASVETAPWCTQPTLANAHATTRNLPSDSSSTPPTPTEVRHDATCSPSVASSHRASSTARPDTRASAWPAILAEADVSAWVPTLRTPGRNSRWATAPAIRATVGMSRTAPRFAARPLRRLAARHSTSRADTRCCQPRVLAR